MSVPFVPTLLAAALVVVVAGCARGDAPASATPAASTSAAAPAADLRALSALARDVYVWGFPIVDNYRVLHAYQIDKDNPEYTGAFNRVENQARLATPNDKAVQTPNADTPYSRAWLDLRAEPMVLSVPDVDAQRYYSVQLIDAYTHNAAYIGSRTTGNGAGHYLIAGPDWHGEAPAGIATVLPMETQFVMAIYRTQLFSPQDMDNVKRIQSGYSIQPLSSFLGEAAPSAPAAVDWLKPVSAQEQRTSLEFFNQLAFMLQFIPAHADGKAFREKLAAIGFVPGKRHDFAAMDAATRDALLAGMREGQALIDAKRKQTADATRLFGTREELQQDVVARAVGAQVGIYGNSAAEAMYGLVATDAAGKPLDGAHRYRFRFAPNRLPPVKGFWSLTMYDLPAQLLVANPLDRYLINSTMLDALVRDPDGGLTLDVQYEAPAEARKANWLPAPKGPFMLVTRYYWPERAVIDGTWVAPKIERVD